MAVMELVPRGADPEEVGIITEELRLRIHELDRFDLLERDRVNDILTEQKFSFSDCTTDECYMRAGQMLSVQKLVAGQVGKVGAIYSIYARVIDVTSGKVTDMERVKANSIGEVYDQGVPRLVEALFSSDLPPEFIQKQGVIAFEVSERGADVFVDGEFIGKTPVTPYPVRTGEYTVRVIKDGFTSQNREVTVYADQTTRVSFDLEPAMGYLHINSQPSGANVFTDGDFIGTTPIDDYSIPVGKRKIRIERDGYKGWSADVNVSESEKAVLSATLERDIKTAGGAMWRSAILPGTGQRYSGATWRGWAYTLVTLGSIGGYFYSKNDFDTKREEYKDLIAAGPAEDWQGHNEELASRYDEVNSAKDLTNIFLAFSIGVWTANVIDAYVFFPSHLAHFVDVEPFRNGLDAFVSINIP